MAAATVYDVIVVEAGNAAICAALSATEQGAKVLMLEKAPEAERGGYSLFTAGGFRFVHEGLADLRRDILEDLSEEQTATLLRCSTGTVRSQTYRALSRLRQIAPELNLVAPDTEKTDIDGRTEERIP